jgi:hypothetical protein
MSWRASFRQSWVQSFEVVMLVTFNESGIFQFHLCIPMLNYEPARKAARPLE